MTKDKNIRFGRLDENKRIGRKQCVKQAKNAVFGRPLLGQP